MLHIQVDLAMIPSIYQIIDVGIHVNSVVNITSNTYFKNVRSYVLIYVFQVVANAQFPKTIPEAVRDHFISHTL